MTAQACDAGPAGAVQVDTGADRDGLRAAAWSLHTDRMTGDTVERLGRSGIPAILLKGPAIGDLIDDPARTYADCDLLVPPGRFQDAEAVLSGMDLKPVSLDVFEHDYVHPAHAWVRRDGAEIDLHRTFDGVGVAPEELFSVLWDHTEPMSVGGRSVPVLDRPARLCLLTLHAAKDGARVGRPLRDLQRAISALPLELWTEAAHVAERIGAAPAFAVGLGLVDGGERLAADLSLSGTPETATVIRAQGLPPLAVGLDWFINHRSMAGRLSLALRKTFPPRRFMLVWSPLARKGPLGLAAAYLWRPVWLAVHLPKAIAAVRKAAKRSKRASAAAEPSAVVGRIPVRHKVALAARIARSFVVVHYRLRRRPLPEVVASLRDQDTGAHRVEPRRLGRLTVRLLRVGDRHARCLINSLVLFRLLRRQGDDPELVIGLPESPEDVSAHAWIELDGHDVGPPPGRGPHEELTRYR